MTQLLDDQAAFEAWFTDGIGTLRRIPGGYSLMSAQTSWNAWRAATQAERDRCAALVASNAEVCSGLARELLQSQAVAISQGTK